MGSTCLADWEMSLSSERELPLERFGANPLCPDLRFLLAVRSGVWSGERSSFLSLELRHFEQTPAIVEFGSLKLGGGESGLVSRIERGTRVTQ